MNKRVLAVLVLVFSAGVVLAETFRAHPAPWVVVAAVVVALLTGAWWTEQGA